MVFISLKNKREKRKDYSFLFFYSKIKHITIPKNAEIKIIWIEDNFFLNTLINKKYNPIIKQKIEIEI